MVEGAATRASGGVDFGTVGSRADDDDDAFGSIAELLHFLEVGVLLPFGSLGWGVVFGSVLILNFGRVVGWG